MRLSIHPDAERELFEAGRYYNSQNPGLGSRFSAECNSAVERICDAPQRFSQLTPGVRRFRLKHFPIRLSTASKGKMCR